MISLVYSKKKSWLIPTFLLLSPMLGVAVSIIVQLFTELVVPEMWPAYGILVVCILPPCLIFIRFLLDRSKKIDVMSPWFFGSIYWAGYLGIGSFRTFFFLSEAYDAYIAILIGLIFWYVGLAIAQYWQWPSIFHNNKTNNLALFKAAHSHHILNAFESSKVTKIVLSWMLVSTIAAIIYFVRAGIPLLADDFSNARIQSFSTGGAYFLYLFQSIKVAVALYFGFYLSALKTMGRFFLSLSLTIYALFLMLLIGARGAIVHMVIWLIIIYHYSHKSISLRKATLLTIPLILFIAYTTLVRIGITAFSLPQVIRLIVNTNGRTILNLSRLLPRIPDLLPYQFGKTYLQPFLLLLPGQQETVDMTVSRIIGWSHIGGAPPTLAGELYINFGWVGIIVGSLFIGYCFGKLRALLINRSSPTSIIIYGYLMIAMLGGMVSGLFLDLQVHFYLGLLLLFCYLSRSRINSPAVQKSLRK